MKGLGSTNRKRAAAVLFILIAVFLLAMAGRPGQTATAQTTCNLPPTPEAGETITWRLADSPYEICASVTIPAGGEVLVEAGVEVHNDGDNTLFIGGALSGAGTAEQPIVFTAPDVFPPAWEVAGTVNLTFADISGQLRPASGGTVLLTDTTVREPGTIFMGGTAILGFQPPFLHFERVQFLGAGVGVADANVVLLDSSFSNAGMSLTRGYIYLDNNTFEGGVPNLHKDYQPVYVDNVTVRNVPGAALNLGGSQAGNNFFLGPQVVLENNHYPLALMSGGLVPGSRLPASGNTNNAVLLSGEIDQRGPVTLPDPGIPYVLPDGLPFLLGRWEVLPGVTMLMGPDSGLAAEDGTLIIRGRAGAPVTFQRLDPAQSWWGIREANRLEHAVVEGSEFGLIYATSGQPDYVDSTVLRNNDRAVNASAYVQGSDFLNNGLGVDAGWLNGETNPNSFMGNTLAVDSSADASHNWWGDPSGPTSPDNPGGTGDPISQGVPFEPFRTEAPDRSDAPPVVQLNEPHFLAEPGSRMMIRWDSEDDGSLTGHRVLFSPAGRRQSDLQVIADLPADQRAFEWTVPDIGFQNNGLPAYLRVVAVDDGGQEGWDEVVLGIPSGEVEAELVITSDLSGPFRPGDEVPICWDVIQGSDFAPSHYAYLFLEDVGRTIPLGGTNGECLSLDMTVPFATTDMARVGVKAYGTANRFKWFYSDFFSIRLDPRVPDGAPAVALLSPMTHVDVAPDSTISISWTAGDDEALRGFHVHGSYDGGRTWHPLAENLPADARSFTWQTAPGTGFNDVQIRVTAIDRRFQHTSAATTAGGGTDPTPTPSLTPTSEATPTPTPTAAFTSTPTPTAEASPTPTPTADAGDAFCQAPDSAIPDNGGVSDSLAVDDGRSIEDLNVYLDISHTRVGDLVVTLRHVEARTGVALVYRPGVTSNDPDGCLGDDVRALLDNEAATDVAEVCEATTPTIEGTFRPFGNLGKFDGEAFSGTWQLTVRDENGSETGTLNEWCLEPALEGEAPTPTNTPLATATPTATNTPTATASSTPTPTNAPTATNTPEATATNTPMATATDTPAPTNTPSPTATPTVTPTPGDGAERVYFSFWSSGNVGGVDYNGADVLSYDRDSGAWEMAFDAADVGLTANVDAFAMLDDGSLLLSFVNASYELPGVGSVEDRDIVRFVPTSLGPDTAGHFEMYFDGSDVGFGSAGQDIDAVTVLPDGRLILSTLGSALVDGITAMDEDMLAFTPTSLGEETAGSWALYLDGSDVGLDSSTEDVWGVWVEGADIYFSTLGAWELGGAAGNGNDILLCTGATTGANSTCSSISIHLDGDAHGLANEGIDAFFITR